MSQLSSAGASRQGPILTINDFEGLVNNVDPRDIPLGAGDVQLNAACVKAGELQIRQGLRELTFDSAT